MRSVKDDFKNFRQTACSTACHKTRPLELGVWLQIFHTIKVITSDLQNCCSDEDLSTAPWSFFSSFVIFLFFLYLLNDVRKITKESVDQGVAHSTHYVTQTAV